MFFSLDARIPSGFIAQSSSLLDVHRDEVEHSIFFPPIFQKKETRLLALFFSLYSFFLKKNKTLLISRAMRNEKQSTFNGSLRWIFYKKRRGSVDMQQVKCNSRRNTCGSTQQRKRREKTRGGFNQTRRYLLPPSL